MSRKFMYALLAATLLIVSVPGIAIAIDRFSDVPVSNVFHDDIAWLADNGVTRGCNPPANTDFCPSQSVRRDSMAAFMHRLAVNKVVDAKTAITAQSATNAITAQSATNAGKVDGYNADALSRVDGATGGAVVGITSAQTVLLIDVDAPTAGFLAITGSFYLDDDCSDSVVSAAVYGLMVNDVVVTAALEYLDDCLTSWNSTESAVATTAVQVPAGVSTVELRVAAWTNVVYVAGSGVSTTFSPFGSGASLAEVQVQSVGQADGRDSVDVFGLLAR